MWTAAIPGYGIGDKVRVIRYGALVWDADGPFDMMPELIGQTGIVSAVVMVQGRPQYTIENIPGKHAWYDEDQMEMINSNPNNTS